MVIRGEMLIELGDSWFIAKTMLVVISLSQASQFLYPV